MATYGTTDEVPASVKVAANTEEEDESAKGLLERAAPYLAEFVGTFLLVFSMGTNHIAGDPMWNPTGVAFALVVATYTFGPVSGAHLNPAVTLTLGLVLKFPWEKMMGYMVAQVAGAVVGSLTYTAILLQSVQLRPPKEADVFAWYDIAGIEVLYTFLMCFVFINCISSRRNNKENDQNHFFALAIGFVYIAGGYSALNISGGMFNPAASLAYAVTSRDYAWSLVYMLAEFTGAWLASMAFAIVRPEDFKMQYDGSLEEYEVPIRSKLFSELIGTFLIVMTVGLNLVTSSSRKDFTAGPWSSGACYMSLMYALGDVSGGHFNPAVTLAVMLSGRGICSFALGQSYIVNQLLAGIGAGVLYAHFDILTKKQTAPMGPSEGYDWGQAGMGETVFTALMAFAFLAIATTTMAPSTTKTNFYFGLAIGSCITIGGFAVGTLSGGVLNPAVALGRCVAQVISLASIKDTVKDWGRLLHCVWYGLFELGGGVVAAIIFFLTHQREYVKDGSGFPHIP